MKNPALILGFLAIGCMLTAGPLGFEKPEYAARRQKLMDKIPDGFAIVRNAGGGQPNLDFLYLCGVKVPNAILIIDGQKKESSLYYTTTEDYLKGEGLDPDLAVRAQEATGVDHWDKADQFSALFEYECKRKGCKEMAFDVIISSAENHKYLHYAQHNRLLTDRDFLVVDAGPAWEDYDTDISISFPVNGKFTPRQKEIYEACKAVSLSCLEFYKPGVTGYEVGAKVKELLISKGFNVDTDAFGRLRFFKEGGITHSVGLATHDCGGADVPKNVPLRAGMVFACDVFATFPDEKLGVRVENTVLITETGCENLTAGVRR